MKKIKNILNQQNQIFYCRSLYLLVILFSIFCPEKGISQTENISKLLLEEYIIKLQNDLDIFIFYNTSDVSRHYVKEITFEKRDLKRINQSIFHPIGLELRQVSFDFFALVVSDRTGILKGTIRDEYFLPLSKATIFVPKLEKGTYADLDGYFELAIPEGQYDVEISYVGMEKKIVQATVEKGKSTVLNTKLENSITLDRVVVIGSKIFPESIFSKSVSTESFTGDDPELIKLDNLNATLHYAIPSFYSVPQTIADGSDHIRPISMKGMDPGNVLVMLNGKKRHNSAIAHINGTIGKGTVGVDLDVIPQGAIETIEVLHNESNHMYGNNAIAGSINFQLKENTGKNEFSYYSGISSQRDGLVNDINYNLGTKLKDKGFINLNLNFKMENDTDRSGEYTGSIFGDGRDLDEFEKEAFYDNVGLGAGKVMQVGKAKSRNYSLFLNLGIPINEKNELYGFGGASLKVGKSNGFYRFPHEEEKQSGLYEFGFRPQMKVNIWDGFWSMGARGDIDRWKFDISNTIGFNKISFNLFNSNNASLGLNSPTSTSPGGFMYVNNLTNFELKRKFGVKNSISIGAQVESELYVQQEGDPSSYIDGGVLNNDGTAKESGFQLLPGLLPEHSVEKSRVTTSLYSGVEFALNDNFKVDISNLMAIRLDNAPDIGSKFSFRYEFIKGHVFRGGLSFGYKLPDLAKIYRGNNSTQVLASGGQLQSFHVTHINELDSVYTNIGLKSLTPERTIGFDLEYTNFLNKKIMTSVHAYSLLVHNRIFLSSVIENEFLPTLATGIGEDIEAIQFFSNGMNTRTLGIETNFRVHHEFSKFKYMGRLSFNLFKTTVIRNAEDNSLIELPLSLRDAESRVFNREDISRIESGQPSSVFSISNVFSFPRISFTLRVNRFGEIKYLHPKDGNAENWKINNFTGLKQSRDQVFSSKWLTSLQAEYVLADNAKVNIGVDNVFNVFPDPINHSSETFFGVFNYSRRVQQFGTIGRYFHAAFRFDF